MGSVLSFRGFFFSPRAGIQLAVGGLLLWTASLPFAMAQTVRFTSISLFVILGGFLVQRIFFRMPSGFPPLRKLRLLLPLLLLSLLPLLHFIPSGENQRELLLGLPLLLLPPVFLLMSDDFPVWLPKMLLLVLTASFFVLLVFLLSKGPFRVWMSVRSETEIPDLFLLARPQLGLLCGMVYFLLFHSIPPLRRPLPFLLLFLFFALILWWILAKIALIAFFLAHLAWLIYLLRNRPLILISFCALLFLVSLAMAIRIQQSGWVAEALSREGLSFEKYPKALVNSINSRIVLWKASAGLLADGSHILLGLPSGKLESELQKATARYNGYLAGQKLNPHNQFLYLMLHYGLPGFLVFCLLWISLFRQVKKQVPLVCLVFFFLVCSQTEIFIDREFGIQLYLLLFLLMAFFDVKFLGPKIRPL